VWEFALQNDCDKDFIIEGIKHGFKLVDSEVENIHRVSSQNHNSALVNSAKVEKRIQEEISEGSYVETKSDHLRIISRLAAIEKAR